MTAAQRQTLDWAKAQHAQLDAEARASREMDGRDMLAVMVAKSVDASRDILGAGWFDYPPPQRTYLEPVSVWTQYRLWLLWGCKSGSFAAILALGIYMGLVAAALAMGAL